MDSFTALAAAPGLANPPFDSYQPTPKLQLQALVTTEVLSDDAASVNVDVDDIYKSLSVSAQKIIGRLNEILADKVPGGIESLKPEDHTPDKTADQIVSGIAGLFEAYAKSNADLSPDELITRFFTSARKGVNTGYDDAVGTLQSIGAFDVDGVKDGVEQTKTLIEQKLKQLEQQKRREYGLDTQDTEQAVADITSSALTTSAGVTAASAGRLDLSA